MRFFMSKSLGFFKLVMASSSLIAFLPLQHLKAYKSSLDVDDGWEQISHTNGPVKPDEIAFLTAYEKATRTGLSIKISDTLQAAMSTAGDILQTKGKQYIQSHAEAVLEKQADIVTNLIGRKIHDLFNVDPNVQVVGLDGKVIGNVEFKNATFIRSLVLKLTGVDLNDAMIPSFLAKPINNQVENYFASYVQETMQSQLKAALTRLSINALGQAMGLAEDKIEEIMSKPKFAAAVVPPVGTDIAQQNQHTSIKQSAEDSSFIGDFLTYLSGSAKSKLFTLLNDIVNETLTATIKQSATDIQGNLEVRVEALTGAVLAAAGGLVAGPTGFMVVGSALHADTHIAKGAKEPSYLQRFVAWLVPLQSIKVKLEEKATTTTTNIVNANLSNALKAVGADILVPTEAEMDMLHGKFAVTQVDEDGFSHITRIQDPYSIKQALSRANDTLKLKAKEKLQTAKGELKYAANAFTDAADAFAKALNPMLDDEDENTSLPLSIKTKPASDEKKAWWKFW